MEVTFHILALMLAKSHTHSLPTHLTGITLKCLLGQHRDEASSPIHHQDLITCQAKGQLAQYIQKAFRIGDTLELSLSPPKSSNQPWKILGVKLQAAA